MLKLVKEALLKIASLLFNEIVSKHEKGVTADFPQKKDCENRSYHNEQQVFILNLGEEARKLIRHYGMQEVFDVVTFPDSNPALLIFRQQRLILLRVIVRYPDLFVIWVENVNAPWGGENHCKGAEELAKLLEDKVLGTLADYIISNVAQDSAP